MKLFTKKIIAALSLICVFALGFTLIPFAEVLAQGTTATITAPTALRTGADLSYDAIATLSKGTQVTIVNAQSQWSQVKLDNGKTGYCENRYLDSASKYAAGVTTSSLYVRSGPGTSYKAITTLPNGTSVTITDNTNPDWAKVRLTDGTVGYCSKQFMTITSADAPKPPETQEMTATISDKTVLHTGPGVAYSSVSIIAKDTAVKIIDNSNPAWAKISLPDSTTGYCSTAFLTNITVPTPQPQPDSDPDTTGADYVIPKGKTLYIEDEKNWSSSDTNVVSVENGFIAAVNTGRATVTSDGHSRIIAVTKAEPVKLAYTSPNSAPLNSEVSFIAITDTTRTGVKFEVNGQTINVTSKKLEYDIYYLHTNNDGTEEVRRESVSTEPDSTTRPDIDGTFLYETAHCFVWTGTCQMTSTGTFQVQTYSQKNGEWSTCDNGNTTVYVTTATDTTTTSVGERRTSDDCIRIIGEFEGFAGSKVYADQLAGGIPTLGYGLTISSGEQFYNDITEREAYALLVQTVNKKFYSTSVNNFLVRNSVKCNQQQFDALVSFTYNLGSGWMGSSDLSDDLLNAFDPATVGNGVITGTVFDIDSGYYLAVRDKASANYNNLQELDNGDVVTILDNGILYNGKYYRVRTADGLEGYCTSDFLKLSQRTGQRDLAYISPTVFIKEIIQWHRTTIEGGITICSWGLLYRRYDEAEMFLYGDYVRDGRSNKYGFPVPSCMP